MENKTILDRLENLNEQLNLTHYWIILLKYKKLLFLIPILSGVLGYLIALNINPVFQSNATLVIEESAKNIVDIEEVYDGEGRGGFRATSNYINNQTSNNYDSWAPPTYSEHSPEEIQEEVWREYNTWNNAMNNN